MPCRSNTCRAEPSRTNRPAPAGSRKPPRSSNELETPHTHTHTRTQCRRPMPPRRSRPGRGARRVRRQCCRQCCRGAPAQARCPQGAPPCSRPMPQDHCRPKTRQSCRGAPAPGKVPAGCAACSRPMLPKTLPSQAAPPDSDALNPKSGPIAGCCKTASGTRGRFRRSQSPKNTLSLLQVRLPTKRLSRPGRLPSTCTLEAHPQRGRPIGRPAAGRRCWSAAVVACGRGLQPAASRRRPGAGARTDVYGRRKRWPPPGGSHSGRCSGSRRRSRCRPLPCSRRGGRHLQLQ
jgi:hypothetical protein